MSGAEVIGECHLFFEETAKQKFMTIGFVTSGNIKLLISGTEVSIHKNQVIILPSWSDVRESICSEDFHAYLVSVSFEILMDISRTNAHLKPRFPDAGKIESVNHIILTDEQMHILVEGSSRIIGALGNKKHHFIKELNYALYTVLMTDFINIMWEHLGEDEEKLNSDISRTDDLFRQFMMILDDNIEKESNVEFYANKMFISKQYLSLIVKKQTKVPVGTIIARTRYQRAAKMLRNPEYSVQQIAHLLSFADQSAFGKFFKKHSGVSPSAFRKDILTSLTSKVENQ
jgi:AraC-like DNA-binding protein